MSHINYSGIITDIERGLKQISYEFSPSLNRYLFNGIEPGKFLQACIENDLLNAVCRANDNVGLYDIRRIMQFFYNDCPSQSWGSKEKRTAWQQHQGALGSIVAHQHELAK